MKPSNRSARWQLDLFLLVMSILAVLAMYAQLPTNWYIVIEGSWSLITLGGMAAWVWTNRDALDREDQQHGHDPLSDDMEPRSIPLTPTQQHFLEVMQHNNQDENRTPRN